MGGTHWIERFSHVKLRELRKERGFSQVEFAPRVGQIQAAYSRYETGKHRPSAATLFKFAGELNVRIDDLLEPGPVDMGLLRARQNLSQRATADLLGISRGWYGRIEARKEPISRSRLLELARILKVHRDEIAELLLVDDAD